MFAFLDIQPLSRGHAVWNPFLSLSLSLIYFWRGSDLLRGLGFPSPLSLVSGLLVYCFISPSLFLSDKGKDRGRDKGKGVESEPFFIYFLVLFCFCFVIPAYPLGLVSIYIRGKSIE